MSIDSMPEPDYDAATAPGLIEIFEAPGFPPPRHAAEADVFARHEGVPGHNQEALSNARIVIVGAGGLGSWVALALARSGARHLTLIDPDRFDRTNASRQLMFGADIGEPKAVALARNVAPHMIGGGTITALCMSFQDAIRVFTLPSDVVVVGVDNNACRWDAAQFARRREVACVFAMLSLDGARSHSFLQEASPASPCLWCALPNLDPDTSTPCAAGIISSCLITSAAVTDFVHRSVMGWPENVPRLNWRAADLMSKGGAIAGRVPPREDCPLCRSAREQDGGTA